METQLIIDWISVTSHRKKEQMTYACYPALHDWENWELSSGRNGYNEGAKHMTGAMVYRNSSRVDMGIHVVYSGKTLQKIKESFGVDASDIVEYHSLQHDNFARIDIALDIKNTDLTVQMFVDEYKEDRCITKLRTASEIKNIGSDGHTFYIGSTKKRKKLMRIYDKKAETNTSINWIRIEAQVMGKPATELTKLMYLEESITRVMLGALFDIADFPMIDIWKDIIDGREVVNLGASNKQSSDTRKWLDSVVFKSILKESEKDKEWFDEYVTSLLVEARRKK